MRYELIERPIYSEDDFFFFEDKTIKELKQNRRFKNSPLNKSISDDLSSPLGSPIRVSNDLRELEELKEKLEIRRYRKFAEGIPFLLNAGKLETQFFESDNFEKLQGFYQKEFQLNLNRVRFLGFNGNNFQVPDQASDQQVLKIKELIGISFFEILEVASL